MDKLQAKKVRMPSSASLFPATLIWLNPELIHSLANKGDPILRIKTPQGEKAIVAPTNGPVNFELSLGAAIHPGDILFSIQENVVEVADIGDMQGSASNKAKVFSSSTPSGLWLFSLLATLIACSILLPYSLVQGNLGPILGVVFVTGICLYLWAAHLNPPKQCRLSIKILAFAPIGFVIVCLTIGSVVAPLVLAYLSPELGHQYNRSLYALIAALGLTLLLSIDNRALRFLLLPLPLLIFIGYSLANDDSQLERLALKERQLLQPLTAGMVNLVLEANERFGTTSGDKNELSSDQRQQGYAAQVDAWLEE